MNLEFPKFVQGALAPRVGKTTKFIGMLVKAFFRAHSIPLTKEQFIVLLCLEEGNKSQSFLAIITERDKGSLTRLIQSLEKKKFIKRKNSSHDKRVNQVEITSKGVEILEHTKPIMQSIFKSLQNGLEPHEILTTISVLEKIQINAQKEIERIEAK